MELRKDYILERYVIISDERAKRPSKFKKETPQKRENRTCFFCPGNEHTTPPEIGRIGDDNGWSMRWFPNKFAAVFDKGDPNIKTDSKYFTSSSNYGFHEVIVETDDHSKQLVDLEENQIKDLLKIYSGRIKELSAKEGIKYVSIFKNHGKDAGTSLAHSHSQVIAYNKIPSLVKEKLDAVKSYDSCPYCEIIEVEKGSFRRCFENNTFAAFTPYASRFQFELWIFPKQHIKSITEMGENMLSDLASVLKSALLKLKEIDASYNIALFYSPEGEDLHFHIEITPRLATWAGFEISTNDIITSISPESAAKFYREEE